MQSFRVRVFISLIRLDSFDFGTLARLLSHIVMSFVAAAAFWLVPLAVSYQSPLSFLFLFLHSSIVQCKSKPWGSDLLLR